MSQESLDQKEKIKLQVTEDDSAQARNIDESVVIEVTETAASTSPLPDFGGRFEVLAQIGEGGMGVVYKVRDPDLNRIFAVKVMRAVLTSDKQALKRFEREADAAIKLNHGGLVSIYEHNILPDGTPYLVMDFIDGQNLADVLSAEGRIDAARAARIFDQVADALEHVHEAGLVHRDVKPRNIILCKTEGGDDSIKLVDFGIAKDAGMVADTTVGVTQTGDFLGSPLYMSPEQCQGAELEPRSDIYSAGCVLYEMLTGKTPFASNNPVKIVVGHLSEKPALPSLSVGEKQALHAELDNLVLKCLEKTPSKRYQSAKELRQDLEAILSDKTPFQQREQGQKKDLRQASIFIACLSLLFIVMSTIPTFNELLWSVSEQLRPYAFPLFGVSSLAFLSLSMLMSRLRSQGQSPQENKALMVPWVVSYAVLIPSFLLLPRLPADSAFIPVYLVALALFGLGMLFSWARYLSIPKDALFAPILTAQGRVPTVEENRQLRVWRLSLFASAVFGGLLVKGPELELLQQFGPIVIPSVVASVMMFVCLRLARRVSQADKVIAGDRWLLLALGSGVTCALGQVAAGVASYLSSMFMITTMQAGFIQSCAMVATIAPLIAGTVFFLVWVKRRQAVSPFGKPDGW